MKDVIRNEIRHKRDSINPSQKNLWDTAIFNTLISLNEIQASRIIFTYVSFRSEVCTRQIIKWIIENKQYAAIPKIDLHTHKIVPYLITNLEKDTKTGHFGILEPLPTAQEMPIGKIDAFLIPALAFDMTGHRIGYGRRYFDKFLENIPPQSHQIKIGLTYELQIIPSIPIHEWDIPVDIIITQERIIRTQDRDF